MMIIILVSAVFLYLSFKGKNPLSCSLFLILSLIVFGPVSAILVPSWYTYVFLIVFVGGIFVLVVYLTTTSYIGGTLSVSEFTITFILMSCGFFPAFTLGTVYMLIHGITALLVHEYTWVEFLVLVLLSKTLFFISYLLYNSIAIRKW